jgi:precorrin-2 dehydrogenase/sirohydrochlorin ferrochelatase
MPANPGFQVTLDVRGRSCIVIGGDQEAADKVQRLLDAGAKVAVVSPTLNEVLRKLTASAKVLHRGRRLRETDLQEAVLVINTLRGDEEFSRTLLELAQKERVPLCSLDQPEYSTLMMPALVTRGNLRVAISTSGTAPALASKLRQGLEDVFDTEFQAFLEWLGKLREDLQENETDTARRQQLLREAVEGFQINATLTYPKAWQEAKAAQAAQSSQETKA